MDRISIDPGDLVHAAIRLRSVQHAFAAAESGMPAVMPDMPPGISAQVQDGLHEVRTQLAATARELTEVELELDRRALLALLADLGPSILLGFLGFGLPGSGPSGSSSGIGDLLLSLGKGANDLGDLTGLWLDFHAIPALRNEYLWVRDLTNAAISEGIPVSEHFMGLLPALRAAEWRLQYFSHVLSYGGAGLGAIIAWNDSSATRWWSKGWEAAGTGALALTPESAAADFVTGGTLSQGFFGGSAVIGEWVVTGDDTAATNWDERNQHRFILHPLRLGSELGHTIEEYDHDRHIWVANDSGGVSFNWNVTTWDWPDGF